MTLVTTQNFLAATNRGRLNIEILGIGFPNKGAELMLAGIIDWARTLPFDTRLVVGWQTMYRDRVRYELWAKSPLGSSKFPGGTLSRFLPAKIGDRFGFVSENEIDVVVDASGYAYSDSWGGEKARARLGSRIVELRRRGVKVVMLPQAFGPFTDTELIRTMRCIVSNVNLLFARDEASYEALVALDPSWRHKVCSAPDFTCLVAGRRFPGDEELAGTVGLIPNHKMYQMRNDLSKDQYIRYFASIADRICQAGRKSVLILHEGMQDLELCNAIAAAAAVPIPVIYREDPREIKMAIGQCDAIVTSRFHGFASALYQGVPAVTTSWSHKYEQLARQYDCADSVIDGQNADFAADMILALVQPETNERRRQKLLAIAATQKEATSRMWASVTREVCGTVEKHG